MHLKELPLNERPRERCLKHGPGALSLRECIVLVLGHGTKQADCLTLAQRIMNTLAPSLDESAFFDALKQQKEEDLYQRLLNIPELGPSALCRILALLELLRRNNATFKTKHSQQEPLLAKIPRALRTASHEWVGIIPVLHGKPGEFQLIQKGESRAVSFSPVSLFAPLLALGAESFFLFHNHPSGLLQPSADDRILTEQVSKTARALGMQLARHGIIYHQDVAWVPVL